MSPVGRRLLNLLMILSLLLCAVTAVLWVRSYSSRDVVVLRKVYGNVHNPDCRYCGVMSSGGGLRLS
jgi:hypothetical protein